MDLVGRLAPNEMVEADKGYRHPRMRTPLDHVSRTDKRAGAKALARQEIVNRRFKQFECLKQMFRHELWKHRICFETVVVCTQLGIERGECDFPITY